MVQAGKARCMFRSMSLLAASEQVKGRVGPKIERPTRARDMETRIR